MKTKLKRARDTAATLLIAAILAAGLSGCGGSASIETKPEIPTNQVTTTADPGPISAPAEMGPIETEAPAEETEPAKIETPTAETEKLSVENAQVEADPTSADSVAALGRLVGSYSENIKMHQDCAVDCEDAHNPYDMVWEYGDPDVPCGGKGSTARERWGAAYQEYVDTCDWSLVFDAEYYKKAFPMLAVLYHNDDALLLEHFQTRGVHEGRQACAGFNVSAYRDHCNGILRAKFGEDYECYYFYYMLNYDTQKNINASNKDGKYPLWRTVELSRLQSTELAMTNKLRAEAGAEPVEPDPELMALACYRAWNDAVNHIEGHEWVKTNKKDVYGLLDLMSMDRYSENTVKQYDTLTPKYSGQWLSYKNSKAHYEAMIKASEKYMGVSNVYVQPQHDERGTLMTAQFEVYSDTQSRTPNNLD